MREHPAARAGATRKADERPSDSVHQRHEPSGDDADAWPDDTGPAARLLAAWKHAIARNEHDLLRLAGAFALVDVAAALSACFVPFFSGLLGVARWGLLVVFVPACLRLMAIRHADRPDAELVIAIAVAVGVGAVYFAVRTAIVVQVCAL